MAPNVTVHFWDANDINGTPILEITDEDTFFKGLTIQPDLYSVGGWQLTLARAWGFQLFGSGAVQPEVFVRFIVHAYSDTTYYYGGQLDKRNLIVIDREEIGAEQLVIGGRGPKAYMDRSALGIEQRAGLGFNLDLDNGVWRWNESATAGRILDAVVDEDNARPNPSLPDLTSNFDDTNDSDGNPWTNEVTPGNGEYETPVGSSLLDVIWDLEDSSEMFTTVHLGTVASPQYQLNAFQSFGDDNTGTNPGAGVCILREGLNIANDSLTVEGVAIRKASHVIVEGKDGVWVTEVRPTWSPGDYVKWDKIEYSRSSSEAILHRAGLRWLQRQTNGDQQITVELLPGHDEDNGYYFPRPDGVLWLGNTITLDTVADGSVHSPLDYNNADALVTGWELALGEAGDTTTPTKTARSWTVKVNLNGERAGFAQSPNQTSAATGNNPCQCPPLCHAEEEGTPFVQHQLLKGDDPGGDPANWVGLLSNQQPGGALGTTYYNYKSNSPNVYQTSLACSAGDSITAFGYWGCRSIGHMTLAFGTAAAGSAGGTFSGTVIGTPEDLHPNGPAHSHTPNEWTFFSQTVIAPSGTNSYALGHTSGTIDFDEVQTGASAVLGDNPYAGTEHGAARCDHNHPASDIEVTPIDSISSDNVQDALEEIAQDYQDAIADAINALSGDAPTDMHGNFIRTAHGDADNDPYLLTSTDGINWTLLSEEPLFEFTTTGSTRDPSLFHYDGAYWIAHTGPSDAEKFTIWRSDELLSGWVQFVQPDCSSISPGPFRVWAPEWFLDTDGSVHIFFAASHTGFTDFQIYEIHPTDREMTTWSSPVQVTGTSLPANMIDPFMVKRGDTYHLWYKEETGHLIEYMSSTSLTSGYTVTETGDWAGWGAILEAPCVVKLDDDRWRIYAVENDGFSTVAVHYSDSTDDWATWSALAEITDPVLLSHGTFIRLPKVYDHDKDPEAHANLSGASIDWAETADISTLAFSDVPDAGVLDEAARGDHVHGMPDEPSGGTGVGPILISDTPSTPLVFADLIQNEAQDDLVYADI